MKTSRVALFAFATIIGSGSLVSSAQQAAAGSLDFLNRMNPQYKNCVATTRANKLRSIATREPFMMASSTTALADILRSASNKLNV